MVSITVLVLAEFSILILTGLFSDKLSKRNARFPRLIALIVFGILLGQLAIVMSLDVAIDTIGNPELVLFIAEFALSLVLFKEGLELNLTAFRKSLRSVLILAFGAVILSSIFFAITVSFLTPLNFFIALLIAGIMAPTDPAATFSMFKGGLRLKPKEKNIIGSESALNDAVAIVIVTELFLSAAENGHIDFSILILSHMVTSFFGGILLGYTMGFLFLKINQKLDHFVQTSYLALALVSLSFVIPVLLHDTNMVISAPITSLTAGSVFGNPQFFKFPRYQKTHLNDFTGGISEIGEIVAFGAFGTLFSFHKFWLALALAVLFAIITLGSRFLVVVYILRYPSKLTRDESIFIAWGGMRGLATAVLAIIAYQTFLVHDGGSAIIDPEVFLSSILLGLIIMTIVQGSTLKMVGMKTKSINLSNRKSDLLVERKIIISKLAFYQKERDIQELTMNEYKEITIPLRDRLTKIYFDLQMEIVSRRKRMRSLIKELEMLTTVIIDLGIDQDNIVLHEKQQEIKKSEGEIVEQIQSQLSILNLELSSLRTRSVDKKNILELLEEAKAQISELVKRGSSTQTQKIFDQIESILNTYMEEEEKLRLAREAEEKEILAEEIDKIERLEKITEEKEKLEKEVQESLISKSNTDQEAQPQEDGNEEIVVIIDQENKNAINMDQSKIDEINTTKAKEFAIDQSKPKFDDASLIDQKESLIDNDSDEFSKLNTK